MLFIYLYLLNKINTNPEMIEKPVQSSDYSFEDNFSNFFFSEELINSAFFQSFISNFRPLEVDLSRYELPRFELPRFELPNFEFPRFELPSLPNITQVKDDIQESVNSVDWISILHSLYELEWSHYFKIALISGGVFITGYVVYKTYTFVCNVYTLIKTPIVALQEGVNSSVLTTYSTILYIYTGVTNSIDKVKNLFNNYYLEVFSVYDNSVTKLGDLLDTVNESYNSFKEWTNTLIYGSDELLPEYNIDYQGNFLNRIMDYVYTNRSILNLENYNLLSFVTHYLNRNYESIESNENVFNTVEDTTDSGLGTGLAELMPQVIQPTNFTLTNIVRRLLPSVDNIFNPTNNLASRLYENFQDLELHPSMVLFFGTNYNSINSGSEVSVESEYNNIKSKIVASDNYNYSKEFNRLRNIVFHKYLNPDQLSITNLYLKETLRMFKPINLFNYDLLTKDALSFTFLDYNNMAKKHLQNVLNLELDPGLSLSSNIYLYMNHICNSTDHSFYLYKFTNDYLLFLMNNWISRQAARGVNFEFRHDYILNYINHLSNHLGDNNVIMEKEGFNVVFNNLETVSSVLTIPSI